MKEVFLLYGWTSWVYDDFDSRCAPQILEIYDNFESAFVAFKRNVEKAFESYKNDPPEELDEECVNNSLEAELFADYNCGRGFDMPDGDVFWSYTVENEKKASWTMFGTGRANNEISFAELHLEKRKLIS